MKAIGLLFADPPSIHKEDVSRVYRQRAPGFPGKDDGWHAWQTYLSGEPIPHDLAGCRRLLGLLRQIHSAAVDFAGGTGELR